MEKENFFKTKAGGLTIAFLVIMLAFAAIMIGLSAGSELLCMAGCLLIAAAMLYSPVKVYLLDKRKK